MTITFQCSSCQTQLRVGNESAGKQARCPRCGQILPVPNVLDAEVAASGPMPGGPPQAAANPYAAPGTYTSERTAYERQEFVPTVIDAGDILSRSWQIFSENIANSLLVTLGYFALNLLVTVIPVIVGVMALVLSLARDGPPEGVLVGLGAAAILLCMVGFLIAIWLQIGITIYFLKLARGQDAQIGDLFSGAPYLVPYMVVVIVYGLMVGLGLALCIVPGFYLALLFYPCAILVIDQETRFGESFDLARQATEGNKAQLLFVVLAYIGISFVAGSVLSIIGQWLVMPYTMLMLTVAYLAMTGQPTTGAAPPRGAGMRGSANDTLGHVSS